MKDDYILPISQNFERFRRGSHSAMHAELVYRSAVMHNLINFVDRVSKTDSPVLIFGESGTGKEALAQRIFKQYIKDKGTSSKMVAVNCSTLKDSLFESELFGHEKGAFSGAMDKKLGLAERAHEGVLFLDEVSDLSLNNQVKLLRLLESGEFYRVGGLEPIRVNIRVISSSNKDLNELVKKGLFRSDLLYRINTVSIEIPPLRARREDILVLIDHFLERGKLMFQREPIKISKEALRLFESYDWPGNVRELQNLMERLQIILQPGQEVQLTDLPSHMLDKDTRRKIVKDYDPSVTLAEVERQWIVQSLEYFHGNKTQAAENLGITIKTLYNKLHEYNLFQKYSASAKTSHLRPKAVTLSILGLNKSK